MNYLQHFPIVQDFEDVFGEDIFMSRSDMVIATTEKIATKYISDPKKNVWVVKETGKNAAKEVVYIKTLSVSETVPSWIPVVIL